MMDTVALAPENVKSTWPEFTKITITIRKKDHVLFLDAKYKFMRFCGYGAYGTVIKARVVGTDKYVAIKKVTAKINNHTNDSLRCAREADIASRMRHAHISKMIDMIPPETKESKLEHWYMVSEAMDTDMFLLLNGKQQHLTESHVLFFAAQALSALDYIHSQGIIHRDIKPSNFLINGDCTLKLCDFGLACRVDVDHADKKKKSQSSPNKMNVSDEEKNTTTDEENKFMTGYVVTRYYRAPELLGQCHTYDAKIDVWAMGCVLAELYRYTTPGKDNTLFNGKCTLSQLQLIFQILGTPDEEDLQATIHSPFIRQHVRSHPISSGISWSLIAPGASESVVDLLKQMLQFNPAKRCTSAQAFAHPCFDKIDIFRRRLHVNPAPIMPGAEIIYRSFDDINADKDFNFNPRQFPTMLEDFAWEKLYQFRPELRPAAGCTSRMLKYLPMVHKTTSDKPENKNEKCTSNFE